MPKTLNSKLEEKPKSIPQKFIDFISVRKRAAVLALIIVAAALFLFFRFKQANNQKPQYQTARAEKTTLVSSVSVSGQVLTTDIVNITTSASGVVKQVFVKDGDTVSAGDKIAEITLDTQGHQQYTQDNAAYIAAQASLNSDLATQYSLQSDMFTKWEKFNNLAQNSTYQNSDGSRNTGNRTLPEFTTVQDDWLAAEAKYKNQKNLIAQDQANLSSRSLALTSSSPTLTAPVAGKLTNLTIIPGVTLGSQGSSVSVGTGGSVESSQNTQKVATIQNEGVPIATLNVSEVDINQIKVGQKATITLDSLSGKTFTGEVAAADHIGAVSSGVTNYTVLIKFDTGNEQILPNMAASANIIVDTKDNVTAVPSSAIVSNQGQTSVRVLRNGQVQEVPVETGISSDTQTEIISGISEGDEVVTGTIPQTQSPGANNNSGFRVPGFGGGLGGGGAFRPGGGFGGAGIGGNGNTGR